LHYDFFIQPEDTKLEPVSAHDAAMCAACQHRMSFRRKTKGNCTHRCDIRMWPC